MKTCFFHYFRWSLNHHSRPHVETHWSTRPTTSTTYYVTFDSETRVDPFILIFNSLNSWRSSGHTTFPGVGDVHDSSVCARLAHVTPSRPKTRVFRNRNRPALNARVSRCVRCFKYALMKRNISCVAVLRDQWGSLRTESRAVSAYTPQSFFHSQIAFTRTIPSNRHDSTTTHTHIYVLHAHYIAYEYGQRYQCWIYPVVNQLTRINRKRICILLFPRVFRSNRRTCFRAEKLSKRF